MSLETWTKEFYPISADECKEEDALDHSLQKWMGLRKGNLEKHKVVRNGKLVIQDKDFNLRIDCDSCALCTHYLAENELIYNCDKCPLSILRDFIPCDEGHSLDESPYLYFTDRGDPELMIALIQKAIEMKGK